MPEIKISPDKLADALKADDEFVKKAQYDACFAAALRLEAHLKQLSDELKITASGVWKNSNKAERTEDGAVCYNDSPHAGIVEEGCRPHWMPKDVIEGPLTDWVRRKLEVPADEAQSVAYAIAHKIAEEGMQGRFPYALSLFTARDFYHEELTRLLA